MKFNFKSKFLFVLFIVTFNANSKEPIEDEVNNKANQNVPAMKIVNTYFTPVTVGGVGYRRLSIVMENNFRPCENNTSSSNIMQPWIEVREEDSGTVNFDMFSSVVLAAILADKRVNMKIDDTICYGTSFRAKLNSINLIKD